MWRTGIGVAFVCLSQCHSPPEAREASAAPLPAAPSATASASAKPAEPGGTVADLAAICRTVDCRPPMTVRVPVDAGRFFEAKFPAMPYTYKDVVRIVPGDDFYVAADLRGDALVNLRHVDAAQATSPNVLHFKMKPSPQGVGADLIVESTFSGYLRYHGAIAVAGQPGFHPTSLCPIIKMAFEHWNDPVVSIVLAEFTIADPGDMGCHV
jgi:hypothetical protein